MTIRGCSRIPGCSRSFGQIIVVSAALCLARSAAAGEAQVRPLVLTGDPAAGWVAGAGQPNTFDDFAEALIASDGRAWFIGEVGTSVGVWSASSRSDIQLVAQAGQSAAGLRGHTFSAFTGLLDAGSAQVAIGAATHEGPGLGVWIGTTKDDLRPLYVQLQPAAGYPRGWSYNSFPSFPVFSAGGTAALGVTVQGPFVTTPYPHYEGDYAVYTGTRLSDLQPVFKLGSLPTGALPRVFGLTNTGRLILSSGPNGSLTIGSPGGLQPILLDG